MKALAMFPAAALLVLAIGCQEEVLEPIVAKNDAKPAPTVQKLQINEKITFVMPDGTSGTAEVSGEFTYKIVQVEQASLGKEIPVVRKALYDLRISGNGEMVPAGTERAEGANALAKPYTWSFSGIFNTITEEGAVDAYFKIQGPQCTAFYHVRFILAGSLLKMSESYLEFGQQR